MASALTAELAEIVGPGGLETDPAVIGRRLRDNSWLSPVLSEHIGALASATVGSALDVEAVVSPANTDQLARVVAAAYRGDAPITMLGAGTSNFGQSIPLHGGLVVELSRLNRRGKVIADDAGGGGRVTVEAGAVLGRIDDDARAAGLELPVVTTTYASATAAGWVAGGHVGLGSSTWGTIWDGNITGATVMTCEAEPRLLALDRDSVEPVLHAYGTTGIITDVTFRLVPARPWVELMAAFSRFEEAARFVADLADRVDHVRVAAAQEPALTPAFTALSGDAEASEALVLAIVASDTAGAVGSLARGRGSRVIPWSGLGADRRPTLGYMVYGHRMLWVKKLFARAAFLHCYLDPVRPVEQLLEIKGRFGDRCLVELKYIRSEWLRERYRQPGQGVVFAPLVGMVDGRDGLDELLDFCDGIGVTYQNPHTFYLDEQGLFADPAALRRFKQRTDPKGLLNPGKLSTDRATAEARTG